MEFVALGQYIAAFAFVLGLIGLMALAMRKFSKNVSRRRGAEARLEIVESLAIDARSRLLLIRRDNTEHLLVKSGEQVTVIEADIPVFWEEELELEVEEYDADDSASSAPEPQLMMQKERADA